VPGIYRILIWFNWMW